jgi:DNA-binding MarR family transcriptional regulator
MRAASNRSPVIEDAAEPIDLSPLRAMVGFHIHILDLMQYQVFYQEFGGEAFTPGVFSTLAAIRQNPGIRHGALADALLIQRPNLTTLINKLERDGYVCRRPSRDDKRWVVLYVTDKGAREVDKMLAQMLALDRRITSKLTGPERKTLLALLNKARDGLR